MSVRALLLSLALGACHGIQGQMTFGLTSAKEAYAAGEPLTLTWRLHNDSRKPWIVLSHMTGGSGDDYEQIALEIDGPGGRQRLSSFGTSTSSFPSVCRLLPGEALEKRLDLRAWATGNKYNLRPGSYTLRATYAADVKTVETQARLYPIADCGGGTPKRVTSESVWTGPVTSASLSVTLR